MAKAIERAALALCCGALGTLWAVLLGMLRQQGRLLARIEALEAERATAAQTERGAAPPRHPVGAPFAPFELPDLAGASVTLDAIASRRILFVHWDPGCGFCERIGPDLAALSDRLAEHDTELVLVSHGTPERNRDWAAGAGVRYRILLQADARMEAFKTLGTPVAYLVDEQRRVAAPLATGADEVLELARAAARGGTILPAQRPLTQSRIERHGIRRGARAPDFTLPDLDGREVALADFRGRRVLLVFSDPACGPCDEVAAALGASGSADEDPALLMISHGDLDANRRKAAEHGIRFPVLLQAGRRVARDYGIFATPVAFLISEDGRVATDVAKGPHEVLALAGTAQRIAAGARDDRAVLPVMFSEGSPRR